jgi:hypothetical protein
MISFNFKLYSLGLGCTTNFPLDAFALLYFAFSLSFFQREGCPWDRVSLYWQSLKDEKGNLLYTLGLTLNLFFRFLLMTFGINQWAMKKRSLLVVLSIVLSSCNAPTPKVVTREQQSCKLKIGDTYAGGIVFYLDTGGECHGLVCAPYDQAKETDWEGAATFCKSLRLGGYSDWRLPSEYELNQMYLNLYKAGLGGFASIYYWSSTREVINYVLFGHSGIGFQYNSDKGSTGYVRPVRAF